MNGSEEKKVVIPPPLPDPSKRTRHAGHVGHAGSYRSSATIAN